MTIAIIDCGSGTLRSAAKAVERTALDGHRAPEVMGCFRYLTDSFPFSDNFP
ncbi:hypothetical protein [Rhodospira trueperi]|uniref:Uncharacterized protein n=1 Tax=Rhodospira trueperi TaxID=69960 RepID=A0A1G7AY79_9PROT|nr:hypothetical protein [Rhodospira trueperi]SDE19834.1 hypothetical protein SAMN05421720_104144 [Rhodospira trueperi]